MGLGWSRTRVLAWADTKVNSRMHEWLDPSTSKLKYEHFLEIYLELRTNSIEYVTSDTGV